MHCYVDTAPGHFRHFNLHLVIRLNISKICMCNVWDCHWKGSDVIPLATVPFFIAYCPRTCTNCLSRCNEVRPYICNAFCYRQIRSSHDLWAWWRHQIETFSALLALCAGNSHVTGEFPSQRPVTQSFDVFFDLRQTFKQTIATPVIWDAIALIMTSL